MTNAYHCDILSEEIKPLAVLAAQFGAVWERFAFLISL